MKNQYYNIRESNDYQPPVARKVILALSLLQEGVTLSELKERLNLSKSGVQRYLNMFVSFGFEVRWYGSLGRGTNVYKIANTKRAITAFKNKVS